MPPVDEVTACAGGAAPRTSTPASRQGIAPSFEAAAIYRSARADGRWYAEESLARLYLERGRSSDLLLAEEVIAYTRRLLAERARVTPPVTTTWMRR